ncbi:MAG: glycoside hydrolase family 13 protein [Clostridia bacterium]|nr:glycoside hydrolase family 13 protein [Clostridia bacterium]
MKLFSDPLSIPHAVRLRRASALRGDADCFGAFSRDDKLTMILEVDRALECRGASWLLVCDDDQQTLTFPLHTDASDYRWDRFVLALPMTDVTEGDGLFWCRFALDTAYGRIYTDHSRVGELSLTRSPDGGAEQLTVYDPAYDTPVWITGGIMYHIFVDRFCPGGEVPCKDYARLEPDWAGGIPEFAEVRGGRLANTTFFGGTLWGVAEQMDYIASLGTRCIYLSPIFEAHSNHKYDTGDYLRVDEMFGGDEALRAVIDRAKDYGIRVILDGVFNHTGDDSRYFNRYGHYPPEGACDSPDSPYYPWYTFRQYPDTYRCWWDIDILPAVCSDNEAYRRFICGEVARKWGEMGIGGWRLDVADELANVFLEEFREAVKSADPEGVIYGEVWEDASNKIAYDARRRYFRGKQLDAVMNYPLREAMIAFVRDGDGAFLRETVMTLVHNYPPQVLRMLMNNLGTHDTERILNVLADHCGDEHTNRELSTLRLTAEERALGAARLRCAYAAMICLPGVPCVYYGDEVGMEGWRDPFNRLPYPWGREDKTMLSHYRRLGGLRASSPALADGKIEFLEAGEGWVLFSRSVPNERLICAVNVGNRARSFTLDEPTADALTDTPYCVTEKILVKPLDCKFLRVNL